MLQHHRLIPELLIERFDDLSLVFLPASDQWVRLNATATDLLLSLRDEAKAQVSDQDLVRLLVARYGLERSYALDIATGLLAEWTKAGIVCPVPEENSQPCQNPSV